ANQAQHSQTIALVPQPPTVPRSVTKSNRCAAVRRFKFCEIWGLARQATQLAVECDDDEMVHWLRTFINKKKRQLTQTSAQNNEFEEDEKENLTVANPPITKHKSRPETKRYKSAMEKA
ncbi:33264_t:CDS:1, partial [Racocetra persica]